MINVSNEFLQKLYKDERDYIERIEINLTDGTHLELANQDIWGNSFSIEDAVGGDNTFSAIGSAIVNSCKFSINNIYDTYSDYDFTDAVIMPHVGLQLANRVEELDKGIFIVHEAVYNGSIISITAYDLMSKLDKPYTESTLAYPATLLNIITEACQKCGLSLASTSQTFPRYDFVVTTRPSQESTTFREVVSWCAAIAGCFARINTAGFLELKWFDTEALDDSECLDGGTFDGGTGNYVKPSMRIGDKVSKNGLTVEYTFDGWWHVYGERDSDSGFEIGLYNNILSNVSESYTLKLETKNIVQTRIPSIYYQYNDGSLYISGNNRSPYELDGFSELTELGIYFSATTATALEYDGFFRLIVEKTSQEPYQSGDTADGGQFNPWDTGYIYDANEHDYGRIHIISALYNHNIAVDDVVITQVVADVKTSGTSTSQGTVHHTYGTAGYTIDLSGNDFITEENVNDVLREVGDDIIGLRFRKVDLTHSSDPSIEAGDIAYVYDRKGNRYQILVTRTNFKVGSAQTTVCGADTPARNSATRFSESTKSYVELRKQIQRAQNPYAKALSDLAEAMTQASGLYTTEVEQPDGSIITYKHNMPVLAESDIQMAITSVGATFTNNGTDTNPTWYGFTMDGRVVASILNAAGVNANWIRSGQLIVEDENGNETFFADYATGIVRINATQFSVAVGGENKTIEQINDELLDTINDETGKLRTELNQTIDAVEISVTQTSEDLDELKMHYRFDSEGETIGKSNSDKSIRLANDGISMMVNEESVTRWNQDEMYTPRKIMVPVGGSLQLGDFVFQPRTNGNMSLFYVGD